MQRIRTPNFSIRSTSLLENAVRNAERMKDGDDDVLNSIVMSCASAEAFISEADYWSAINKFQPDRLDKRGRLIPVRIDGKIEKAHQKFERVLSTVMPSFSIANNPFSYLFEKDTGLSYLRNRIVHQNYLDEFASAGSNEHYDRLLTEGFLYDETQSPTQMVMPPDVMKLHGLDLLRSFSKESWATWFDLIKSEKLAWWVCCTTRDAVVKVLVDTTSDFSEGFTSWRKLAVAELPTISLEERVANDSELKAMISQEKGGAPSFVYALMSENQIVFTKASGTEQSGSSEIYAHIIVPAIIKKERIDPTRYTFLDLTTHFNHGFSEDGEYQIHRLELELHQDEIAIQNWIKVAEAKVVGGELCVLEGANDPRVASIAKKFSAFIGKPAPF